jgi:integrase
MKPKTDTESPVLVCHHKGLPNRFFGKFKDPAEADPKKRWKKIPGGAFPEPIDTEPKALVYAKRWYDMEMAERAVAVEQHAVAMTSWPCLCDAFHDEVDHRVRGADASRDELKKKAKLLRRSAMLCSRAVAEHDGRLVVAWVRKLLSEPKNGAGGAPRDPLTVRNAARVLTEIYRFAQRNGHFPMDRRLPTENDEFKAELAGALKEKAKLGKLARVALPVEIGRALATRPAVPWLRRITTRTYFLTGMRPSELHALRVSDLREEQGILFFDVHEQWTLPRGKYPSRIAPLKTVWSKRKIPVHRSLKAALEDWRTKGWSAHVGRAPKPEDFLFPDGSGNPFRELRCEQFHIDLQLAGCETSHKGVALELYSMRHTFATVARRSGIPSDARDRLLGHRPKDTKALHYEDEDLPLLAEELEKIPELFDIDEEAAPSDLEHRATSTAASTLRGGSTADRTAARTAVLVTGLVTASRSAGGRSPDSSVISEEEVRFELTDPLRDRRFSKPLP